MLLNFVRILLRHLIPDDSLCMLLYNSFTKTLFLKYTLNVVLSILFLVNLERIRFFNLLINYSPYGTEKQP